MVISNRQNCLIEQQPLSDEMPIACKYCIALKGLTAEDIKNLPKTENDLYDHIEDEHHIPTMREGESDREAFDRFRKSHPDAGSKRCKCPTCTGGDAILDKIGYFLRTSKAHDGEAPDDRA